MSVLLALPAHGPAMPEFYLPLGDLFTALTMAGIPWKRCMVPRISYLDEVQNFLVTAFGTSEADFLVTIEDDQTFDPRDLLRVIQRAEREGLDCVGLDYPRKAFGHGMVCERVPGAEAVNDLVPCNYLGLGFAVFSRRAIDALIATNLDTQFTYESGPAKGQIGYSVFETVRQSGRRFEPNVVFYSRLRRAGITPLLDTSVTLGHIGTHVYTEKDAFQ